MKLYKTMVFLTIGFFYISGFCEDHPKTTGPLQQETTKGVPPKDLGRCEDEKNTFLQMLYEGRMAVYTNGDETNYNDKDALNELLNAMEFTPKQSHSVLLYFNKGLEKTCTIKPILETSEVYCRICGTQNTNSFRANEVLKVKKPFKILSVEKTFDTMGAIPYAATKLLNLDPDTSSINFKLSNGLTLNCISNKQGAVIYPSQVLFHIMKNYFNASLEISKIDCKYLRDQISKINEVRKKETDEKEGRVSF